MAVFKLLGQHIAYSASPPMQQAAFRALGLDHRYELADVGPERLPAALDALRRGNTLGANVTTPHKGAVMGLLDEVDPLARQAGAVNTIVQRDGLLAGANTDVPAIVDEVRRLRPVPAHAVVLGAGGAARAVQLALASVGAVRVTAVARSGREGVASWSELPALLATADLLVNATPVGTGADETPVDARLLHRGLAVLDLVYRPSPTRLVREARAAGAPARAGAGVLLGQGWRSLELWLSASLADYVRAAMAAALRDELGALADV